MVEQPSSCPNSGVLEVEGTKTEEADGTKTEEADGNATALEGEGEEVGGTVRVEECGRDWVEKPAMKIKDAAAKQEEDP